MGCPWPGTPGWRSQEGDDLDRVYQQSYGCAGGDRFLHCGSMVAFRAGRPRLITYYVLFFIHLGTRKVHIGGITPNPDQQWIGQIVRNITDIYDGVLLQNNCKYLIHDRDSKFCEHFDSLLRSVKIQPVKLPARSPNLNAYAERFILSATRPA